MSSRWSGRTNIEVVPLVVYAKFISSSFLVTCPKSADGRSAKRRTFAFSVETEKRTTNAINTTPSTDAMIIFLVLSSFP